MRLKMKGYYFIWGTIVVLLLFSVSPAIGIIKFKYEGWEAMVESKVGLQYTDNLNFAKEKEKRVEKLMTSFSLSADLRYTGRRRSFGLSGVVNRWLDSENFDTIREAEDAKVRFKHEFSEYDVVSLEDSFYHSSFPVDFEEEFERYRADVDRYTNRFSVVYSKELSEHINLKGLYKNAIYWSSGDRSRDSVANGLGLNVNYILGTATSFQASYGFTSRRYEDEGTASTNSIAVGLRRYITKRLYLIGRVGYSIISSAGNDDTEAVTYYMLVTDEFDERTVGRLSLSRSVRTTWEADVFRRWEVDLDLDRDLMKDLKGSLSGFYGEGEYLSGGIEDKFIGASARLNYIFGKHLTGNLGYRYSHLDSSDEDRGYTTNSVTAGITLTF